MDGGRTTTRNSGETKKLARKVAKSLRPGDVVALQGDLGAGKTTFVQGLLSAFGVKGGESPTFVLTKIYELEKTQQGISRIGHVDAYRVQTLDDAISAGLTDLRASPGTVVVVEWADRIAEMIPQNTLWVTFEHGKGNERKVRWVRR